MGVVAAQLYPQQVVEAGVGVGESSFPEMVVVVEVAVQSWSLAVAGVVVVLWQSWETRLAVVGAAGVF